MTSPFHVSRGLDVCIQAAGPPDITVTPSKMRPAACSPALPLTSLLWLALAVHLAQSWGWGPYDSEWRKHVRPVHHPELVYRVVVPRNGSTPAFSGNGTYTRANATGAVVPLTTSRPTPVAANSSVDTSCGEDSPLYNLQVSRADGSIFDGWWLKLSGNQALFTSQKEKATGFGVNLGTKHLCIPKAANFPLIAIVEARLDIGPLYFLDANFSTSYRPEYEPVVCDSLGDGSQLSCSQGKSTAWSGCGLQLELGTGSISNGTGGVGGGQNCSSIALNAFQASNSALS